MKVKIYSDSPLPSSTLKAIEDIFRESNCPNESMFASIEGFKGFDGKNIMIGEGDYMRCHTDIYINGDGTYA